MPNLIMGKRIIAFEETSHGVEFASVALHVDLKKELDSGKPIAPGVLQRLLSENKFFEPWQHGGRFFSEELSKLKPSEVNDNRRVQRFLEDYPYYFRRRNGNLVLTDKEHGFTLFGIPFGRKRFKTR